jgi:hypothetical protein
VRTSGIGSKLVQIKGLAKSLKAGLIARRVVLVVERKLGRRGLRTLHVDLHTLLVKRLRILNIKSAVLPVKVGRKKRITNFKNK